MHHHPTFPVAHLVVCFAWLQNADCPKRPVKPAGTLYTLRSGTPQKEIIEVLSPSYPHDIPMISPFFHIFPREVRVQLRA